MIKKLKIFYIFLLTLPIIAPISTKIIYFTTAYLLIILTYITLKAGYGNRNTYQKSYLLTSYSYYRKIFGYLVALTPLLAVYAVQFYTGSMPNDVIGNLSKGISNYAKYQDFFANQNIKEFSLNKIPAIISLAAIKISLIVEIILFNSIQKKSLGSKIRLMIPILSYFYISFSRGTTLELFELLFISVYFYKQSTSFNFFQIRKSTIYFAIFFIASLLIFNFNITTRSDLGCVTEDICYEKNFLSFIIGGYDKLLYGLTGYFSFGLFYTHFAIIDHILSNTALILGSFLPMTLPEIIGQEKLLRVVCITLDCGAAWQPDIVTYIFNAGWIITFLGIFICGKFIATLESEKCSKAGLWSTAIEIIIFLGLLSMPFGNIITSSSSNTLALITFLVLRYINKIHIKKS